MSTYVLVHGAWHGAWCWKKIIPVLEAAGHRVLAPDLPGHGNDLTPATKITTELYVESLSKLILSIGEAVILVGHSMGGMVISQIAEHLPEHISRLVYLSGFLLKDGQCIREIEAEVTDSLVSSNLTLSADKLCLIVDKAVVRDAFYADCSDEDAGYAISHMQAQPILPFLTPISISNERYDKVPRVYIECLLDRALPVSVQRAMHNRVRCHEIHTLRSGHSPFLSVADDLSGLLLQL